MYEHLYNNHQKLKKKQNIRLYFIWYVCVNMHFKFDQYDSVLFEVVFIQLCRGLSPDAPVWDFSPLSRVHRCFGVLVFSHLPSLSSHHCSC